MDINLNSMDPNFAFVSSCFPGARLKKLINKAVETLTTNNTFSLIIVFGGINDITRIANRPLWIIRARFDSITETVNYVEQEIREGLEVLRAATQIPVVFCPTIGIELNRYSPNNADALNQQQIIEQSVKYVNRRIYAINSENHTPTPLLESTIHKCKGRSRSQINYYARLEDGCHPTPATRSQWAEIIFKSTAKFLEL